MQRAVCITAFILLGLIVPEMSVVSGSQVINVEFTPPNRSIRICIIW
jgi:hypothetical protein